MRRNVLDLSHAETMAGAIIDVLEGEGGYTKEEIIPGLVQAVIDLADGDDTLLDAAANLLADNGVRHLNELGEGDEDA